MRFSKTQSAFHVIPIIITVFMSTNGAFAQSDRSLKIESSSKSSSSHRVILSNALLREWVVCWGLNSEGTPLAKGESLVKGRFVEVMIMSREHHEDITKFYCEYRK